jgi:hypothetical protein
MDCGMCGTYLKIVRRIMRCGRRGGTVRRSATRGGRSVTFADAGETVSRQCLPWPTAQRKRSRSVRAAHAALSSSRATVASWQFLSEVNDLR